MMTTRPRDLIDPDSTQCASRQTTIWPKVHRCKKMLAVMPGDLLTPLRGDLQLTLRYLLREQRPLRRSGLPGFRRKRFPFGG